MVAGGKSWRTLYSADRAWGKSWVRTMGRDAIPRDRVPSSFCSPEPSVPGTVGEFPVGQVPQEAAHVVLIVGPDQGKADGQVGQRVGGQQRSVLAQVKFIDAQSSEEPRQDLVAV